MTTAKESKPTTVWNSGRLDSRKGSQRLLFGQMYEDVEIEVSAFKNKPRIFCIAAAGATALKLAEEHQVVACDINPVQLSYAQGRAKGEPFRSGDAERAMAFVRSLAPLAGWRRNTLRKFLALSDVAEQSAFWHKQLDTIRFRTSFDLLLSRTLLRLIYSPTLLSGLPPDFGAVMRARWERCFTNHANATNPYARSMLLGESTPQQWPRSPVLKFVPGDAASYLESCAEGSFDGFALSNILDGAASSYSDRLSRAVQRTCTDGAVVVRRSFNEPTPEMSENHAESDRSMLWGVVEVCGAKTF